MLFCDGSLARRIELNKATGALEYARAQERLRPGTTAVMPIAGGNAVFVGAASPISRAMGLGIQEGLTEADLDATEAFFSSRAMAPCLEMCPLADSSLLRLVRERGYRIAHFRNVLIRPLTAAEWPPEPQTAVTVTRVTAADRQTWIETVARGFVGRDNLTPDDLLIPSPMSQVPAVTCYLAWQGDEPIGAGAMAVRGGLAFLSSTSVRPAFRGRGAQAALLSARLTDAAAAGCDLMAVETSPGSPSQRNVERVGFRVAYTTMAVVKE